MMVSRSLLIAIRNEWFDNEMMLSLFSPIDLTNEVLEVVNPGEVDMLGSLVRLGLFSSKSQARKNWRGPSEIKPGFTHLWGLGKLKKELVVWLPVDDRHVR